MVAHSRHFAPQHYEGTASGPFSFLNPTTRRRPVRAQDAKKPGTPGKQGSDTSDEGVLVESSSPASSSGEERVAKVEQKWRSRDNRKGRHAIVVTPDIDGKYLTPPPTNTVKETLKGIWRMFSTYPYWDVSYLVAVIFTLGSVVWCINAFFAWLPLAAPSTEFDNETTVGGGVTAFIGATIFEVGSVLLMLEAVNEERSDCFGWALEEVLEENGLLRLRPDHDRCSHHHKNKGNLVGKGRKTAGATSEGQQSEKQDVDPKSARAWTWWPTWKELTTHYIRELGFLACFFQLLGASIFWISGFTALPGINNNLSPAALNGAFWAPQVIGGTGFIISGTLFMLETQQKWYLPAPKVLGWHIGLWNLVGAFGFTLCGALGFSDGSREIYQSSLATFWGSWAFLIGSLIQWFESLDKHPVDVEEGGGRVADTKPVA